MADVRLTLAPAMTMAGRIVFARPSDAPEPTPANVEMRLISVAEAQRDPAVPHPLTTIHADGRFEVRGILPGTYRIDASARRDAGPVWRPRSAVAGGRDLLDVLPTFLGPADTVADVVLELTNRHSELTGMIERPDRQDVSSYFVVVCATDRTFWRPYSRRIAGTTVDPTGAFIFRDLPPGDCWLGVLAHPPTDAT